MFKNLSITRKLIVSFVLIVFLSLGIGFVGAFSIIDIYNHYLHSVKNTSPAVKAFSEVQIAFFTKGIAQVDYIRGNIKQGNQLWQSAEFIFQKNMVHLKRIMKRDKIMDYLFPVNKLKDLTSLDRELNANKELMIAAWSQGGSKTVLASLALRKFFFTLQEGFLLLEDLKQIMLVVEAQSRSQMLKDIKLYIFLIFFITFTVILLGLILAFVLSQRIAQPILALTNTASQIRAGDFTSRAEVDSKDEVGLLSDTLNQMLDQIQQTTVSKDYVDNIITSMADTLIVVNPEGNIQTANQATLHLLGYQSNEVLDKPISMIIAEEEEEEEGLKGALLVQLLKQNTVRSLIVKYRRKDGTLIPMNFSGSTMRDREKKLIGIVGIAHDMREIYTLMESEKKALEKARQKAVDAEESLKKLQEVQTQLIHASRLAAVGELAAGVAHEINNPLAAILGHTQLLSLQIQSNEQVDLHQVQETCKVIEESTLRCKRITESLLRFSRRDSQQKEKIDIHLLIDETFNLIQKQLELSNIKLVKKYSPLLPQVHVNKNQIGQVILNLITNALDAMEAKKIPGTLTIATTLDSKNNNVFVCFQDTGEGISKENQAKVFQPFFTTKEPGKGTGLGLALSHGIMRDHDGKIEIESEVGKGTTITLIFPVVKSKSA